MRAPVASTAELEDGVAAAWQRARAAGLRLERVHPAFVLAPLCVAQLAALLALALTHPHNGWLFYNGGDASTYWTEEWSIATGHVPRAVLGFVLPVFYGWVPHLLGTTLLEGLPAIVLLQALVLVPLAVCLVYLVAQRLAGRLYGLLAAVLWVVTPLAAIRFFRPSFRPDFVNYFLLPHGFGLTNMGDFPSVVVALALALAVFRALDSGRRNDALLAGVLLGFMVGLKPANVLIVPAVVLAFLAERRFSHLLVAAAGVLPAIVALAVWKQKGLGTLPLFALPETKLALGASLPGVDVSNYLDWSWNVLHENLLEFREVFWDVRVLEYVPLAGTFALVRKVPAKGIYVAAWFAAYFLVKGGAAQAHVYSTSLFRLAAPGFPAFVLMLAAIVLLVPGWGRRAVRARAADVPLRPTPALATAAGLLALVPLLVVVALPAAPARAQVRDETTSTEAPISAAPALTARRAADGTVTLDWRRVHAGSSSVFYLVYRTPDDDCRLDDNGVGTCLFEARPIATTRATSFVDRPPAGSWTYRVATAANFHDQTKDGGDLMLMSRPAEPAAG